MFFKVYIPFDNIAELVEQDKHQWSFLNGSMLELAFKVNFLVINEWNKCMYALK